MENEKFTDWLKNAPDYGIFPPPMETKDAFDFLRRYLLGDDWYCVNPISPKQINTEIVHQILFKYSREYRKEYKKARKDNAIN